jgi:hypothetical protein
MNKEFIYLSETKDLVSKKRITIIKKKSLSVLRKDKIFGRKRKGEYRMKEDRCSLPHRYLILIS